MCYFVTNGHICVTEFFRFAHSNVSLEIEASIHVHRIETQYRWTKPETPNANREHNLAFRGRHIELLSDHQLSERLSLSNTLNEFQWGFGKRM